MAFRTVSGTGLCFFALSLCVGCSAADAPPNRAVIAEASGGAFSTGGEGGFDAVTGASTGGAGPVGVGAGGTSLGGAGGGGASAGGSSSGGAGTGGASAEPSPACLQTPSQVILIGDSYINWISHTFAADLNREAGETFRMYAVGGTSMGSGGIGLIPPQFDQALAADPDITTVVMDGGGNDVLVADAMQFPQSGSCKNDLASPSIPDCQKIVQKAIDAAGVLMDKMAAAGVKDVVYFFYPHVPEGTLIGGLHPNAILDYAIPKVKAFCDGARDRTGGKLACYFVDMIPVFDGHPDWFAPTDIHPNTLGSAAMAKAIWGTMRSHCIAQPASSGCCTP